MEDLWMHLIDRWKPVEWIENLWMNGEHAIKYHIWAEIWGSNGKWNEEIKEAMNKLINGRRPDDWMGNWWMDENLMYKWKANEWICVTLAGELHAYQARSWACVVLPREFFWHRRRGWRRHLSANTLQRAYSPTWGMPLSTKCRQIAGKRVPPISKYPPKSLFTYGRNATIDSMSTNRR